MKKIYLSILSLLLCFVSVQAQNAVVAGAAKATSSQGAEAGFTVGQLAVESSKNSSGKILLGIMQDFSGEVSAIATNPIGDKVIGEGVNSETIRLDEYFMSNETLSFSVSSSDDLIARPMINGQNLVLEFTKSGTAVVTIVAETASGERVSKNFSITVGGDRTDVVCMSIEKEPTVSVLGHTIYVSNVLCGEISLYDIAGKRLFSSRNAQNTQITLSKTGVYVLMMCGKQQNVIIQ